MRRPLRVDEVCAVEALNAIRIGDVHRFDQSFVVRDRQPFAITRGQLIHLRALKRAGDIGHFAIDVAGEVMRGDVAQRERALMLGRADVADPSILQCGHDRQRRGQHDGDGNQEAHGGESSIAISGLSDAADRFYVSYKRIARR